MSLKAIGALVVLLGLSLTSAAEIVYLKRSQLGAFVLGQQIGEGVAQIANARAFTAYRLAGYAQLDALKKELASCGNCAHRERLNAEIKALQAAQLREDRIMCGTWESLGFANPSAEGIKKLTGYVDVCNRFNQEAGIIEAERKNRQNKEEFARRIKEGDLSAYVWMGRRTFVVNRQLSYEDQANLACPYYAEGARRGVDIAAIFFAQECFGAGEAERREGFEMLKSCAAGSARCAGELAPYYESTRRSNVWWPVPADDREALTLYEQALLGHQKNLAKQPGDAQAARSVTELQAKVTETKARLDGHAASGVAPAVPANVAPVTDGAQSGGATSDATTEMPDSNVSPGAAGSGRAAMRPSQQEQPRRPVSSRPEIAAAQRERIDPMQRRCEILLLAVQRNQALATADARRYGSRLATAQEQYQRACREGR